MHLCQQADFVMDGGANITGTCSSPVVSMRAFKGYVYSCPAKHSRTSMEAVDWLLLRAFHGASPRGEEAPGSFHCRRFSGSHSCQALGFFDVRLHADWEPSRIASLSFVEPSWFGFSHSHWRLAIIWRFATHLWRFAILHFTKGSPPPRFQQYPSLLSRAQRS